VLLITQLSNRVAVSLVWLRALRVLVALPQWRLASVRRRGTATVGAGARRSAIKRSQLGSRLRPHFEGIGQLTKTKPCFPIDIASVVDLEHQGRRCPLEKSSVRINTLEACRSIPAFASPSNCCVVVSLHRTNVSFKPPHVAKRSRISTARSVRHSRGVSCVEAPHPLESPSANTFQLLISHCVGVIGTTDFICPLGIFTLGGAPTPGGRKGNFARRCLRPSLLFMCDDLSSHRNRLATAALSAARFSIEMDSSTTGNGESVDIFQRYSD